jgi:hypothetical protein
MTTLFIIQKTISSKRHSVLNKKYESLTARYAKAKTTCVLLEGRLETQVKVNIELININGDINQEKRSNKKHLEKLEIDYLLLSTEFEHYKEAVEFDYDVD